MIEKAILSTAAEFSLFKKGQTVTVALSGGADSVALLYGLKRLEQELDITVKSAHLNHLIRGDEATRDEEFVKKLCNELCIPLICESCDVPLFARENGLSLEAAAREKRYEFLNRINEGVIATAHTANDNLETVLLNLTRGTALDGLCGIPVKRDNIVRPIISVTRDSVEAYCKKHGLSFVTDSTNLSNDYTRNKLRHLVVPVLKEINPKVEASVLRLSRSVKEASADLDLQAELFLKENLRENKLNIFNFKNLSKAVGKRVIIKFIEHFDSGISLEACHIEGIYNICINGGKANIPKNMHCKCVKNILFIENTKSPEFSVGITKISLEKEKINNLLLNNSLDCDKIIGKLVIRTRQKGDSIRLLNRGCTKPINKLYNECAVPVNIRDTMPVIADDIGVVWIYGIGVAQRVAVSGYTKEIYKIDNFSGKEF